MSCWSREALNRLPTTDGGALPEGKYVFSCDWHEIEMAAGREPGKYVIRITVDPLSLPDTCELERYGADTGVPFSLSLHPRVILPRPEELFKRIALLSLHIFNEPLSVDRLPISFDQRPTRGHRDGEKNYKNLPRS